MSWQRLGHVYAPAGDKYWARSHAANPIPEHRGGDIFRIYFSSRDAENRSCISSVDVDLADNFKVIAEACAPVLLPGDLGMFDDSGCSIGCIVKVGQRRLLYYMGWKLTVRVPWQNALGLAISGGPDAPFVRVSNFPVMPLDPIDPYTISYPWVLHENGVFRMWYGSNVAWGARKEDMRHLLRYAESDDGIIWRRDGRVVIDFANADEYAICKPCVIKDDEVYRLWFCARGQTYRIFEAQSADGLNWQRTHSTDRIDIAATGWDSEMIEYPSIFDHNGERYLLYCGNAFGQTGFGAARWQG
jgi:hypothetical protein